MQLPGAHHFFVKCAISAHTSSYWVNHPIDKEFVWPKNLLSQIAFTEGLCRLVLISASVELPYS